MKHFFAAAASAAALFGAANAQQDLISNPRGVIPNFDVGHIGPILTEMGAVWQSRKAENGQPFVAVSAGGELVLNIIPTACQGRDFTSCVGMNTVALFSGGGFNYQTVAAFNQKYWFSTAGVAEDGSAAYISRYEISDYGISRGNVAASIVNLIVLADIFRQELATARRTVSLEGFAEDLEARRLNARGLEALGGVDAFAHVTRHQRAMQETVELVEALLAGDAPRNKIENITARKR
jgi:hypothetical protein